MQSSEHRPGERQNHPGEQSGVFPTTFFLKMEEATRMRSETFQPNKEKVQSPWLIVHMKPDINQ